MSGTNEVNTEVVMKRSEGRFEIKLTGLPKGDTYLAHAVVSTFELLGIIARKTYKFARSMPTEVIIRDMRRNGVQVGINFKATGNRGELFRGGEKPR